MEDEDEEEDEAASPEAEAEAEAEEEAAPPTTPSMGLPAALLPMPDSDEAHEGAGAEALGAALALLPRAAAAGLERVWSGEPGGMRSAPRLEACFHEAASSTPKRFSATLGVRAVTHSTPDG
jgi:hypothetical protein